MPQPFIVQAQVSSWTFQSHGVPSVLSDHLLKASVMRQPIAKALLSFIVLHGMFGVAAYARNLPFYQISDEQGVLSNQVTELLQDRDGFVWIGTSQGLSRFDGYRFVHYRHDPRQQDSLSDNKIWSMYQDAKGYIWAGTESGGLNRLDPRSGRIKRFNAPGVPSAIANGYVRVIRDAGQDRIWIGTSGDGLFLMDLNNESFIQFNKQTGIALTEDTIRALEPDAQGGLWVGYRFRGLSYIAPDRQHIQHWRFDNKDNNSLCSDMVQSLYLHQDISLYIGTWDMGLCRLDLTTGNWETIPLHNIRVADDQLPATPKTGILRIVGDEKRLWLGTVNHGLVEYTLKTQHSEWYSQNAADKTSIAAGGIHGLLLDDNEHLWVGTWAGGVSVARLHAQQFSTIRHQAGGAHTLLSGSVSGIAVDQQQTLWVGVEGSGLSVQPFGQRHFSHLAIPYLNQLNQPNNDIQLLYYSPKMPDELWIGTLFGGILRYNIPSKTWTRWKHNRNDPFSLSDNHVRALLVDSAGALWVGTTNAIHPS